MFAHDNNINSGRKGDPPNLTDLDGNGNTRFQFDFRRLYTDFLETWFGASESDTTNVFGESILPMGILKPRSKSHIEEFAYSDGRPGMKVYPNPKFESEVCNIQFDMAKSGNIDLKVYSVDGRVIKHIYEGFVFNGPTNFELRNIRTGHYTITLTINNRRYSSPLTVIK
jgi:hypothetical protein